MPERSSDEELRNALKGQLDAWRANNQRALGEFNEEIARLLALREDISRPLPASDELDLLGRQAVAFQSGDQVALEAVNEQIKDATSRRNHEDHPN